MILGGTLAFIILNFYHLFPLSMKMATISAKEQMSPLLVSNEKKKYSTTTLN